MEKQVKIEVIDIASNGEQTRHIKEISFGVEKEKVMPKELDDFIVDHIGGRPNDRA